MKRLTLPAAIAALALSAPAACRRAGPALDVGPAPLPRCRPGARGFEGHFPRAAGGSPEVEAPWLASHRCEVRVVDVRETDERLGPLGAIDVAEAVPLADVERAAERWSRDQPIALVCRSGRRRRDTGRRPRLARRRRPWDSRRAGAP